MPAYEGADVRPVRIGGRSPAELLADLAAAGVELNTHARTLLASERFVTAARPQLLTVLTLRVRELGFAEGAPMAAICARALAQGLALCPVELGPHFRLQYPDQPEGLIGQPLTQQQAPPGSITVVSAPLLDDDDFPKGFYLRRMEGVLWLRGYRSDAEHRWDPGHRLAFCQTAA